MKTKYFFSLIIISFLIVSAVILVNKVFAQEATGTANVQYPVKELGNCENEAACKDYCDNSENIKACLNFAEKNNMMSSEEINAAKKFIEAGAKGPGGCNGKDKCKTYCDDIANIDECVSYAEKNNLMAPQQLEEAKKVQAAIKKGVKPPSCKNKEECDTYCEDPNHMEECINFGVEAGFMQGKELEDAQKMLAALKKGIKPMPCKGKQACDEYCNNPDNMETCMNFAMEAGFMNEQEKANSQKMLQAIKKGVKPPPCKGKDECDVYCSEHFEECMNFSEAAGFMSSEEATMARKTGGKGPGGCKNKEECDAFCNNPDNQETCFNFGKENGLIPEADLKQMEEGKQQFKETLNNMPQEVSQCLDSAIGTEMMQKFKSGTNMPPKEIGDKMQTCFQKMEPQTGPNGQGGPGAGGMIPPAGQTGPGGCKTQEECKAFCESHQEECKNSNSGGNGQFVPGTGPQNTGNQTTPQQAGPGGCKNPEECKTYCEANPENCKNSQQQSAPGPNGQNISPNNNQPTIVGPQNCATPEECQKMQTQMTNPGPCQGENCQIYKPPQTNEQQIPNIQQMMNNVMPCQGENCKFIAPPTSGQSSGQQPPQENMGPPPPSGENPPPPPSGANVPQSLLGSLLNVIFGIFGR